jgi:hypothetical protein
MRIAALERRMAKLEGIRDRNDVGSEVDRLLEKAGTRQRAGRFRQPDRIPKLAGRAKCCGRPSGFDGAMYGIRTRDHWNHNLNF